MKKPEPRSRNLAAIRFLDLRRHLKAKANGSGRWFDLSASQEKVVS